MIRQLKDSESGDGGLSSFQTLALTLSSSVGVGSIAGVATAIAMGGPGSIMWMAVTGLLGSTCAYAEAVLAQLYKRRVHGEDRGGMPYYIKYGLKAPWLAFIVALTAMIGYGFVFPGVQSNNIASSVQQAFGIEPWVTGLIITSLLGVVVVGGTKRVVQVAQTVVPFIAVGYLLTALLLIILNIDKLPDAIMLIVSSGMGRDHVFGGIVGYAVAWACVVRSLPLPLASVKVPSLRRPRMHRTLASRALSRPFPSTLICCSSAWLPASWWFSPTVTTSKTGLEK